MCGLHRLETTLQKAERYLLTHITSELDFLEHELKIESKGLCLFNQSINFIGKLSRLLLSREERKAHLEELLSLFAVVKTAFLYSLCVEPDMPYFCTGGVDRHFCLLYQTSGNTGEELRHLNGGNSDSSQIVSCVVLVEFFFSYG